MHMNVFTNVFLSGIQIWSHTHRNIGRQLGISLCIHGTIKFQRHLWASLQFCVLTCVLFVQSFIFSHDFNYYLYENDFQVFISDLTSILNLGFHLSPHQLHLHILWLLKLNVSETPPFQLKTNYKTMATHQQSLFLLLLSPFYQPPRQYYLEYFPQYFLWNTRPTKFETMLNSSCLYSVISQSL